ncbi:MAG: cysteine synthase family protein [Lewinellaceae bacterium]|nr:cysteine synthase family protein [Lewinellaceae bacterium]
MIYKPAKKTGNFKKRFDNVLETIGNTPLIYLHHVSEELNTNVWAKVEAFNPGLSAKDRIALHMIEQAEQAGRIKPGATLVEATSGNTGFSLAMVSAIKGYNCILTVTSKVSQEKINLLRAMGAEVIICPKEAKAEDPNSYYKMAERIAAETPNSYYVNQNYNTENMDAHYLSTGPEIWEQTDGQITHLVGSTGTGGTLCGTAKFIKEQNPDVKVIAVDAYGSALKKFWLTGEFDEKEIYSYRIEGTGKNIIPANVDFSLIDHYEKVPDKESAFRTRDLARKEGLMVGYSSGAHIQALYQTSYLYGPDDFVVVFILDHGSRYLGKVFNDEWMAKEGFMDEE